MLVIGQEVNVGIYWLVSTVFDGHSSVENLLKMCVLCCEECQVWVGGAFG